MSNNKIILSKEETKAIEFAQATKIESADQMTNAVSTLSVLNQTLDRLTESKEKLTKPINELLKEIRGRYKPFETQLEGAIESLRRAMINYQTEQKRIAKEEEDKIIARVGEGKGKLKVETAIKKVSEVEKPDAKVSTEEGMVKFKTVKKFEVVDVSKLPVEFLLANEVLIRKSMTEGKEITGVRYFTEEVPVNTR